MLAAKSGHEQVARMLLVAGANTAAQDINGHTALMHAAGSNMGVVSALLDFGSNPSVVDANTPTTLAALHGRKDVYDLLVRAGAFVKRFPTAAMRWRRWTCAVLTVSWAWNAAFTAGPGKLCGSRIARPRSVAHVRAVKARKKRTSFTTSTEDKVQEVEDYLRRIGGSANVQALKTVIRGIKPEFLQMHFEVSTNGCVKSKKGYHRQEANIKQFLTSKGIVPLAVVLETFRVPKRWLESHKDFFVRDDTIKLRVRPTTQPQVEIVDEHVGHLFTMGPSGQSAEKEISRLRIFLMSKVARLPATDRRSALRRLKGIWHPDVADPSRHDVIEEVFKFLSSIDVSPSAMRKDWLEVCLTQLFPQSQEQVMLISTILGRRFTRFFSPDSLRHPDPTWCDRVDRANGSTVNAFRFDAIDFG
eukprot:symbB.v1.2.039631.t1/scaffold6695.1/size16125/1